MEDILITRYLYNILKFQLGKRTIQFVIFFNKKLLFTRNFSIQIFATQIFFQIVLIRSV